MKIIHTCIAQNDSKWKRGKIVTTIAPQISISVILSVSERALTKINKRFFALRKTNNNQNILLKMTQLCTKIQRIIINGKRSSKKSI